MKRYKIIDHTADIGIVSFGKSLSEAYANSAYAMFDILTDASKIESNDSFEIEIIAKNKEELLVKWLGELLFLYETERILCNVFDIISLDDKKIKARIFYEKISQSKHEIKTEIKNVTYHQLRLEKVSQHWEAQIIFDV